MRVSNSLHLVLTMSLQATNNMASADFSTWVKSKQAHIEQVLELALPAGNIAPQTLHQAMRYSALGGGKRVRALLCYASAELCNTDQAIADAGAAAVEFIHA